MCKRVKHDTESRQTRKIPVAVKLAALAAYGVLLYNTGGIYLIILFLPSLLCLIGVSTSFIKHFAILILIVVLVNLLSSGLEHALSSGLKMSALLFCAHFVSRTTQFSEFLQFFTILATPLQIFGIGKHRVGLTLSMTIRFVPEILALHSQIREAQIARGVKKHPIALFIPLIILTLNMAQEIATAIISRGFEN